jgi:ATPase subunit of ABC transporter with duplicated ATPase domains
MCDDSDACQELIHSIDFIDALEHPELFLKIQKLICRINHSVQQFEKLHLHAERSLFGLRNRKVFEEFSLFLNTAVEIVEEVTSRCSTYTQDLEYARCYGQLHSRLQQQQYGQQQEQQQQQQCEEHAEFATSEGAVYGYGYDYDYSECADPLNNEVESTHQMLSYFDQNQQQLYHQQKCQQEQEQQTGLNLDTVDVVYYEEGVIVEGVSGEGVSGEGVIVEGVNGEGVSGEGVSGGDEKQEESTTNTIATKTTSESEDTTENKKKRGSWLSSWF